VEDENLLEMLEFAVGEAIESLSHEQTFKPFAYALDHENQMIAFTSDYDEQETAYESLTQGLKKGAKEERIKAIVLLQNTPIPATFNIQGEQSIRVHVEHSENIDEKIAARFLYIPYVLEALEDERFDVKLSKPEPVAFPHEIFIR
jgi:hypothetical protein